MAHRMQVAKDDVVGSHQFESTSRCTRADEHIHSKHEVRFGIQHAEKELRSASNKGVSMRGR